MMPGPNAVHMLGSGGKGAFLKGGRVPQAWLSNMQSMLLDAVDRAVGKR
jgi:hypothetical protein